MQFFLAKDNWADKYTSLQRYTLYSIGSFGSTKKREEKKEKILTLITIKLKSTGHLRYSKGKDLNINNY